MSYAVSGGLQAAIFSAISTAPDVVSLVGAHVFDAMPSGPVPSLYVALGAEKVRDASDKTGGGTSHDLTISVVSESAGFATAKLVAGAISDTLIDASLALPRGKLVAIRFVRAAAARVGSGDTRRIDLIFRARVCDAVAPTP